MPSLLGHAVVGATLSELAPASLQSKTFRVAMILCSALPDFDVISFHFGIPYEDILGHRGVTHSIAFALLFSLVLGFLWSSVGKKAYGASSQFVTLFFLATVSHGILDAFTNGGLGVGFFIPFSNNRYFFPWRPIQVSPIGADFFSARAWPVLQSELLWIGIPCAILWMILFALKSRTKSA